MTLSATLLLPLLLAAGLAGSEPMRYIHNAPESPSDHRYDYQWEMLRTALERTRATWGAYELGAGPAMSERRQQEELERAGGNLTIMYLGTTRELEARLLPIRIPIDKDLEGYFVFLIRAGDQARFPPGSLRTAGALRLHRFGLGQGWIDVDILQAGGLQVVTGSNYDGLFDMLAEGRFDLFPRSVVEVLEELEARKATHPMLAVEAHHLLHYPMPMYFWFARSPEGHRLARRVEEGLRAMIADGTFDRIFLKYQKSKIQRLKLGERHLIEFPNPLLPEATPLRDRRLWFDLRRGY